ncbi:MAG: hypothetical protein ACREVV_08285 [Steroidobacteraceae bacterium]
MSGSIIVTEYVSLDDVIEDLVGMEEVRSFGGGSVLVCYCPA